jgi:hypothetical protein
VRVKGKGVARVEDVGGGGGIYGGACKNASNVHNNYANA